MQHAKGDGNGTKVLGHTLGARSIRMTCTEGDRDEAGRQADKRTEDSVSESALSYDQP